MVMSCNKDETIINNDYFEVSADTKEITLFDVNHKVNFSINSPNETKDLVFYLEGGNGLDEALDVSEGKASYTFSESDFNKWEIGHSEDFTVRTIKNGDKAADKFNIEITSPSTIALTNPLIEYSSDNVSTEVIFRAKTFGANIKDVKIITKHTRGSSIVKEEEIVKLIGKDKFSDTLRYTLTNGKYEYGDEILVKTIFSSGNYVSSDSVNIVVGSKSLSEEQVLSVSDTTGKETVYLIDIAKTDTTSAIKAGEITYNKTTEYAGFTSSDIKFYLTDKDSKVSNLSEIVKFVDGKTSLSTIDEAKVGDVFAINFSYKDSKDKVVNKYGTITIDEVSSIVVGDKFNGLSFTVKMTTK